MHRPRDRGAGDEIAPELRKDDPLADGTRMVPGTPDALQAARHRRRRFDLHHEIDRAHVDAELERRGRDERLDPARLQQIFNLAACNACERAVMRAHEWLAGELVQRPRQPLRQPAAVDEDQR